MAFLMEALFVGMAIRVGRSTPEAAHRIQPLPRHSGPPS